MIGNTEKFQTLCIVYPDRFVDVALFVRYMCYGTPPKENDGIKPVAENAMHIEAKAICKEIRNGVRFTPDDVKKRLIESANKALKSESQLLVNTSEIESIMLGGKSRVYKWKNGEIHSKIPPENLYRIADFFHLKPQVWSDGFESQQDFESALRSGTYEKRHGIDAQTTFQLNADEENTLRTLIEEIEKFLRRQGSSYGT